MYLYVQRVYQTTTLRSKGGAMVRALASHQGGRVQIPASMQYVGWVCCWFSPLLQEGFLRVLWFSPLFKTQHFQNQVEEEPLCGYATFKSLFIYIYLFIQTLLYLKILITFNFTVTCYELPFNLLRKHYVPRCKMVWEKVASYVKWGIVHSCHRVNPRT